MVTYMPIPSPFVRLAGFWVDDALSFAMGWNYFFVMGTISQNILQPRFASDFDNSLQHSIRDYRDPCSPDLLD